MARPPKPLRYAYRVYILTSASDWEFAGGCFGNEHALTAHVETLKAKYTRMRGYATPLEFRVLRYRQDKWIKEYER